MTKIEVYSFSNETLIHLATQDISASELKDRDFIKATIYHVANKDYRQDVGAIYYAYIVDPCDPDGIYGEVYDCFMQRKNDDIFEIPTPDSWDLDEFFQPK